MPNPEKGIEDGLQGAKEALARGDLALASRLYHTCLQASPDHPVALRGLGLLSWHTGLLDEARAYLLRAVQHDKSCSSLLFLGTFLSSVNDHVAALSSFQECVRVDPSFHEGWCLLAREALKLGEYDLAIEGFERALALKPNDVSVLNDLGVTYEAGGNFDAADRAFLLGLDVQAGSLALLNNIGRLRLNKGELVSAVTYLEQAIAVGPEDSTTWFNYGNALVALNDQEKAKRAYEKAVSLDISNLPARINLGNLLRGMGHTQEARFQYEAVIAQDPLHHDVCVNLGVTLLDLGEVDAAFDLLSRQAIARSSSAAFNNLGNACKAAGDMDAAVDAYRQAVSLDASNVQAHSNLVYSLSFHPEYSDAMILAEARLFGAAHKAPALLGVSRARSHKSDKRIRIGYVSPDFRDHCQAFFMLPLLKHHDRKTFEIFAYSLVPQEDAVSSELAAHCDHWRHVSHLSDKAIAEAVIADQIDVLIDLTMHMANGRPGLFALRPAPVQIAWLAYPGTTGNSGIDYRLTDPWLDPVDSPCDDYSEQSIRLPSTFWCYDPLTEVPQVSILPALRVGYVTFGCLNNFCKISEGTLSRWAAVLLALPSSRLLLLCPRGRSRERIMAFWGERGVESERIEFVGYQKREAYLETYHKIDICLDTLPYNGHTTSLDAYWMGVPVVTQIGSTTAGRAGWSQLNNLGLTEFAAYNQGEFVAIAAALAQDLPYLANLRQNLRQRLLESPLMQHAVFAQALETVYRQLCGAL